MSTLRDTRNELLKQIGEISHLRRGQLSEQYYNRTDSSGELIKTGPYFVWQAWIKNKKRSIRVPQSDVDSVKRDTLNYQKLKGLFDRLAEVTEEITLSDESADSKKKPVKRRSASRKK